MAGQDSYVFRRSRTLTGTAAPSVPVASERLGQLKTDRLKLHELRAHQGRVMRFLGAALLICAVIGLLVASFIYNPAVVYGQVGKTPDSAPYLESIYKYFNDHSIERFGFLLKSADLESSLMAAHSEISGVAVNREWYGGNTRLKIFFRTPLLRWQANGQQFYVDSQGAAFTYNHFSEPAVKVVDKSGVTTDGTDVVASARFIRFLGRMVGALNGYNKGSVEQVIIPASTREIDVRLKGRAYLIKTNSDRDPLQQAEDIVFALGYVDRLSLHPKYLDVRVPHKAFFR